MNNTTPKVKEKIKNQIIWNNRFIRIIKKFVYFLNWSKAAIEKLSCLVDEGGNSSVSFNAFLQNTKSSATFHNITVFYQQYHRTGKLS